MSTAQEVVERRSGGILAAGALAEGFCSIGAVVLSIIGLTGRFSMLLLAISTIAIGAALLFEGGAVTARFSNMLSLARVPADLSQLGLGMATEFVAGLAGIALGVLALIGIQSLTLVPAAIIIFGGGLLLGVNSAARMSTIMAQMTEQREAVREVMREAVFSAAGVQLLVGIGVITLGILALIRINPLMLSLVATLSLGFASLMSGTVVISRVAVAARRHRAGATV